MPDPFYSDKEDIENQARKTADSSWDSPFHTLGRGATQAAPGNHLHDANEIKNLPAGTALSNNIPKQDAGSGSAGVGTAASRDDHVHPPTPGISLATSTPPADSGSGAVGTSGSAARADHQHPNHNVSYADSAGSAGNADTVDGQHASEFAAAGHGHAYNPSNIGIRSFRHGPYSVNANSEATFGPFGKYGDEHIIFCLQHSSTYLMAAMDNYQAGSFNIKIRNTTTGTNHSNIFIHTLQVRAA